MQKKIKVIFILVISLIVMIYAGNTLYEYFAYTPSERYFYKELKRRIKKGEKEIYLKDLTDFEWDEVSKKGPYSVTKKNGKIINKYKIIGKWPDPNDGYGLMFISHKKKTITIIRFKKLYRRHNQKIKL